MVFSPSGFPHQEPRGQERQRVLLLPPCPMAPLIVGQTGFTLATLETCFQAMCRFGHPGTCPKWRLGWSVGQGILHLHHLRLVAVTVADHHQRLLVALLTPMGYRDHPSLHRLNHQRTLAAIAHLDPVPGCLIKRLAPGLDVLPGTRGTAPPAALRRQLDLHLTPRRVRRHGQHVPLTQGRTSTTQPRRSPTLVVTRHPPMRQRGTVFLQPLQGQRVTRALGSGCCGHARFVQARRIRGPCFRQIQPRVDQGVTLSGDVSQGHGHVAAIDLPRRPPHGLATPTDSRPDLGNPAGSHTTTPSPGPKCVLTWPLNASRQGASSYASQPMKPCSGRRDWPKRSAIDAMFLRATSDRRPQTEILAG